MCYFTGCRSVGDFFSLRKLHSEMSIDQRIIPEGANIFYRSCKCEGMKLLFLQEYTLHIVLSKTMKA